MFGPRYGMVKYSSWAGIILTIVCEFFVVLWSSILVGVCRSVWRMVFTLPYCFPAMCAVFSMVGVSAALASAALLSTEVICA